MRIVVDTNVIVSAPAFRGAPREVIDLAVAGACSFYFSPAIRVEVEEALGEKFGWSQREIAARTWCNRSTHKRPKTWRHKLLSSTYVLFPEGVSK